MLKYLHFIFLFTCSTNTVPAQNPRFFDSLNFFERNHIKTIRVTTYQEKKIVNKTKLVFDKKTKISKHYVLLGTDTIPGFIDVDFTKKFDSIVEFGYRKTYLMDKQKRVIQKVEKSNMIMSYSSTTTYYYSDSLSCRLKLILKEISEGTNKKTLTSYFYYDELNKVLDREIVFEIPEAFTINFSVSSHHYEYNIQGMVCKETIYKDKTLLCYREYNYEFY